MWFVCWALVKVDPEGLRDLWGQQYWNRSQGQVEAIWSCLEHAGLQSCALSDRCASSSRMSAAKRSAGGILSVRLARMWPTLAACVKIGDGCASRRGGRTFAILREVTSQPMKVLMAWRVDGLEES